MSSVLVVQHEDECPPVLLGRWLTEAGCTLEVCRPYAGDALPDLTSYDGVLVLGGPQQAEDDTVAWFGPLKEQLRAAHAAGVPTLGVCLGHQLVAAALGGRVERNPRGQQLGLIEVGWTAEAATDELVGPVATPRRGVHWNDDVVTVLPEGATVLAQTDAGEPQAVRFGPRSWGVQLHPEVDAATLRPWAEEDREAHVLRGIDQETLLRAVEDAADELTEAWRPLARSFARIVGSSAGDAR
ncbi:aminotransferase [Nocardioides psychrotolerans]|uniref:GMP synthase-Glutamine amidotransferase n=1 Tax=Nocardioides psychrotolerans TaxID=1005945 RepID=A0A1I3NZE5_9ACTN|nr:type 1 glutamine amidotransferase [Nocardioides psychrotolerans]GEP39575.1 aminotransferase [Nocardioides psychrotolerans]SFJ14569.1 GMP synthase-Glutamine amidotransferase [Nocardioides psychrotolerans]